MKIINYSILITILTNLNASLTIISLPFIYNKIVYSNKGHSYASYSRFVWCCSGCRKPQWLYLPGAIWSRWRPWRWSSALLLALTLIKNFHHCICLFTDCESEYKHLPMRLTSRGFGPFFVLCKHCIYCGSYKKPNKTALIKKSALN